MRVVFLYVSYKHGFGEYIDWSMENQSTNYYASRFEDEGYSLLLDKMVEGSIVDEALCVIESKDSPGSFRCRDHIQGYVIPSIEDLAGILKAGDIVWVRGGWRHWHDTLVRLQKDGRHWMLIYAANTGRGKWPFWDVVFDDIGGKEFIDKGDRLFLDFRKPMNEDIFKLKPSDSSSTSYDFMIGASRIHDKKGQWRVVDALVELKEQFGINPSCIMPGPMARGVETNRIKETIISKGLKVITPGSLPRPQLADVMNDTRYIIHLGSHGQGDRGVMEAMACGCIPIIGFPQYHARWLVETPYTHIINERNPLNIARELNVNLCLRPLPRLTIARCRSEGAGLYEKCLSDMDRLFSFFRHFPVREEGLLRREW